MKTAALTEAVGVEVKGVNLSAPLSTDVGDALRRLLAAHSLLLFRERVDRSAEVPRRHVHSTSGDGFLEALRQYPVRE